MTWNVTDFQLTNVELAGVLTIICINNVWYLIPDLGPSPPPTPVGNLMIAASISKGYITQPCSCQTFKQKYKSKLIVFHTTSVDNSQKSLTVLTRPLL